MIIQHHDKVTYLSAPTSDELLDFYFNYLKPSVPHSVTPLKIDFSDIDGCDGGSVFVPDVEFFFESMIYIITKYPYAYNFIIRKGVIK